MRALSWRRLVRAALLVIAGIVVVLQTTTTRGYVQDTARAPISNAYVLLGDSTGVIAATRTDQAGYFRFVHSPMNRERHRLLICAEGQGAMVISPAESAIFRSTYGLDSLTEASSFWTPARKGWNLPAPRSCPSGRPDSTRAGLPSR